MGRSTSDSFVRRSRDAAAKQYHIPSVLKGYHEEFSHSRLPQQLKEVDLVHRKLVNEPSWKNDADLERAAQVIL